MESGPNFETNDSLPEIVCGEEMVNGRLIEESDPIDNDDEIDIDFEAYGHMNETFSNEPHFEYMFKNEPGNNPKVEQSVPIAIDGLEKFVVCVSANGVFTFEKIKKEIVEINEHLPVKNNNETSENEERFSHFESGAEEAAESTSEDDELNLSRKTLKQSKQRAKEKPAKHLKASPNEFEKILGRRAVVVLERCALPSSCGSPTKICKTNRVTKASSWKSNRESQKMVAEKLEKTGLRNLRGTKRNEMIKQRQKSSLSVRRAVMRLRERRNFSSSSVGASKNNNGNIGGKKIEGEHFPPGTDQEKLRKQTAKQLEESSSSDDDERRIARRKPIIVESGRKPPTIPSSSNKITRSFPLQQGDEHLSSETGRGSQKKFRTEARNLRRSRRNETARELEESSSSDDDERRIVTRLRNLRTLTPSSGTAKDLRTIRCENNLSVVVECERLLLPEIRNLRVEATILRPRIRMNETPQHDKSSSSDDEESRSVTRLRKSRAFLSSFETANNQRKIDDKNNLSLVVECEKLFLPESRKEMLTTEAINVRQSKRNETAQPLHEGSSSDDDAKRLARNEPLVTRRLTDFRTLSSLPGILKKNYCKTDSDTDNEDCHSFDVSYEAYYSSDTSKENREEVLEITPEKPVLCNAEARNLRRIRRNETVKKAMETPEKFESTTESKSCSDVESSMARRREKDRERKKRSRAKETPVQREKRYRENAERSRKRRANATPEQKAKQRAADRLRNMKQRERKALKERENRLLNGEECVANKTPEQIELLSEEENGPGEECSSDVEADKRRLALKRAKDAEYQRKRRAKETPEQTEQRLKTKAERKRMRIANEALEEREKRLAGKRKYERRRKIKLKRRKTMAGDNGSNLVEERSRDDAVEKRIARIKAIEVERFRRRRQQRNRAKGEARKRRLANETPEQREKRLKRIAGNKRKRRANENPERAKAVARKRRPAIETPEMREKRLKRVAENKRKRKANETPEQREKRLADRRSKRKEKETPASAENWKKRLANETPEERAKRLKIMAESKRKRIANETPEEREKRLAAKRLSMKLTWQRRKEKEALAKRDKSVAGDEPSSSEVLTKNCSRMEDEADDKDEDSLSLVIDCEDRFSPEISKENAEKATKTPEECEISLRNVKLFKINEASKSDECHLSTVTEKLISPSKKNNSKVDNGNSSSREVEGEERFSPENTNERPTKTPEDYEISLRNSKLSKLNEASESDECYLSHVTGRLIFPSKQNNSKIDDESSSSLDVANENNFSSEMDEENSEKPPTILETFDLSLSDDARRECSSDDEYYPTNAEYYTSDDECYSSDDEVKRRRKPRASLPSVSETPTKILNSIAERVVHFPTETETREKDATETSVGEEIVVESRTIPHAFPSETPAKSWVDEEHCYSLDKRKTDATPELIERETLRMITETIEQRDNPALSGEEWRARLKRAQEERARRSIEIGQSRPVVMLERCAIPENDGEPGECRVRANGRNLRPISSIKTVKRFVECYSPDEVEVSGNRRKADAVERMRVKIASETPEERAKRLRANAERNRKRIATEQRKKRLKFEAERLRKQQIANETPEELEKRLTTETLAFRHLIEKHFPLTDKECRIEGAEETTKEGEKDEAEKIETAVETTEEVEVEETIEEIEKHLAAKVIVEIIDKKLETPEKHFSLNDKECRIEKADETTKEGEKNEVADETAEKIETAVETTEEVEVEETIEEIEKHLAAKDIVVRIDEKLETPEELETRLAAESLAFRESIGKIYSARYSTLVAGGAVVCEKDLAAENLDVRTDENVETPGEEVEARCASYTLAYSQMMGKFAANDQKNWLTYETSTELLTRNTETPEERETRVAAETLAFRKWREKNPRTQLHFYVAKYLANRNGVVIAARTWREVETPEKRRKRIPASEVEKQQSMAKKRRAATAAKCRAARAERYRRRNESVAVENSSAEPQQREKRRAGKNEWYWKARENEEYYATVLEKRRLQRANETPEQREKRRKAANEGKKKRKANETPEQREKRLEYARAWAKKQREKNLPAEVLEKRREYRKEWHRKTREREAREKCALSPERGEGREDQSRGETRVWSRRKRTLEQSLASLAEFKKRRRATETPESRKKRLEALRQKRKRKKERETPEQRARRRELGRLSARRCRAARKAVALQQQQDKYKEPPNAISEVDTREANDKAVAEILDSKSCDDADGNGELAICVNSRDNNNHVGVETHSENNYYCSNSFAAAEARNEERVYTFPECLGSGEDTAKQVEAAVSKCFVMNDVEAPSNTPIFSVVSNEDGVETRINLSSNVVTNEDVIYAPVSNALGPSDEESAAGTVPNTFYLANEDGTSSEIVFVYIDGVATS